jgi:hypothetical protein
MPSSEGMLLSSDSRATFQARCQRIAALRHIRKFVFAGWFVVCVPASLLLYALGAQDFAGWLAGFYALAVLLLHLVISNLSCPRCGKPLAGYWPSRLTLPERGSNHPCASCGLSFPD